MTLRRFAVLAGIAVTIISESAAAQVPSGNLPTFDTAPPAVMPMGPGMAPPPGGPPAGAPQGGPQGGFGGAPQGAMGGPPGGFGGPPAGQAPPCMRDFTPLREAAEKRAGALKTAIERKVDRSEFCKLFKDFATAEGKVVKFMTDNQASCGIPPQAVSQVKSNHDRTVKTRDNVCAAAAAGVGGPPPGPRLSDELGVRGIAGPDNTSPGRGTFDTLTGSPLAR